jgi:hypothetical protein
LVEHFHGKEGVTSSSLVPGFAKPLQGQVFLFLPGPDSGDCRFMEALWKRRGETTTEKLGSLQFKLRVPNPRVAADERFPIGIEVTRVAEPGRNAGP